MIRIADLARARVQGLAEHDRGGNSAPTATMPAPARWLALLIAIFAFRLWFGLSREFFFEDETQIFLMGLRYYATGEWPFFGPDVVWTRSEIPGALQPLLVGVPLRIAPYPESSYVLLALLSFGALALLAWYSSVHRPATPHWLVWGWFLTIPWTMQFSGHLINTSYILPGAIVFFLGFFESLPALSLRRIGPRAAHALMGAALLWLVQIHMSWPLLLPFVLLAWVSRWRDGPAALAANAAAFCAGAFLPALLLFPTLLRYGAAGGTGGVLRNLQIHWVSPWIVVTTLARFLSFASLEIARFIATDGAKRAEFFQRHLWLAPVAAVVFVAGVVQPVWMLVDLVRSPSRWPETATRGRWQALRRLTLASVLLVYASYWFVTEPPQAHAFYVLAPLAFLLATYWWTLVDSPRARRVAMGLLALSIAFHAGLAYAQMPELSLYKNREVVAAAVRLKQPEMFAHRRDFAIGGGPTALSDPSRPYDPRRDMQIVSATLSPGALKSIHWTVTLRNASTVVAFRDPLFIASYRNERGALVEERHERIKDIFQPGTVQTIELNDGYARDPFATADLRIVAAEALLPAPVTIRRAETAHR